MYTNCCLGYVILFLKIVATESFLSNELCTNWVLLFKKCWKGSLLRKDCFILFPSPCVSFSFSCTFMNATHSSILAWRFPWQRSLADHSPWGHIELDITERLTLLPYVVGLEHFLGRWKCLFWFPFLLTSHRFQAVLLIVEKALDRTSEDLYLILTL